MVRNSGPSKRYLTRHGRPITIITEDVTHDATSDWGDQSVSTRTHTTNAIIREPARTNTQRNEATDDRQVTRELHLDSAVTNEITIRDSADANGPATRVDIDGNEYTVVMYDDTRMGLFYMEVVRAQ